MSLLERLKGFLRRANDLAAQYYTPREIRAVLLFLLLGVAVLLFRFGRNIYYSYFPNQRPASEIVAQKQQDSLFFALSAAANTRDSLFFSLPEDSLLPPSARPHHSKGEDLPLASISLNNATMDELQKLPGVGGTTAEHIIAYRTARGKFRTLDELQNVKGFGKKRFEQVKRFLRVN